MQISPVVIRPDKPNPKWKEKIVDAVNFSSKSLIVLLGPFAMIPPTLG